MIFSSVYHKSGEPTASLHMELNVDLMHLVRSAIGSVTKLKDQLDMQKG